MDGTEGFRIGDRLYPWGTRFNEVVQDADEEGYSSRDLPCSEGLGFPTVYAEATAPGPDRPVMTVAYEISTVLTPKDAFVRLVKVLGQPDTIDRSGEEDGAGNSSMVVMYASWARGALSYSVSLYGAPRDSDFGPGIGKLYLSWRDIAAAAKPYADAWHIANDKAARAAEAPDSPPKFYVVSWDIFDPDYPAYGPNERALNTPELLVTPAPVATRLKSKGFALWQGSGTWYLSHGRDTVALGLPPHDKVDVLDVEPARSGGFAAIECGTWRVRDSYQSREIAAAAELLERIPGLRIERHRFKGD